MLREEWEASKTSGESVLSHILRAREISGNVKVGK